MDKATQETTTTETKQLSLMDDDISQADYERLRDGEKVEVEVKSAPAVEETADETDADDSETSQTDGDEDDSDSDESELSAKDKDWQKKPKRGFKKRIDKLNAKLTAAEAQAEHWRQQALSAKKPNERAEETPATATVNESEPNADDFESAVEFYKAHAKWAAKEELKAAKESERQEKLRAQAESKRTEFIGKVDEFKKAHDDFEDVVSDVDDIQMSPAISNAILDSDNGPELMYELAKNREEYARICALPPWEAVRALGRFEARLDKPSEEKPKTTKPKTTKAPPPPKPVSTSSANGKKSIWDENISQAEYERMRAEQEKRRASY
jgi:hypothetical protein